MSKKISFRHALTIIVASLLFIPGLFFKGFKMYEEFCVKRLSSSNYITRIVQTGPQREFLNTAYLAQLMRLSADYPTYFYNFDSKLAEKRLLRSPVIKSASVKIYKPDTVFVDYTSRQPMGAVHDFYNIGFDEEGYVFPLFPFFTPKNLPEVYFGIDQVEWFKPLVGEKAELAFSILRLFQSPKYKDILKVQCLDVSNAYAKSLGSREIVLKIEDRGYARTLRLSTKDYLNQISNYMQLRPALPPQPQFIDLRIEQLAFIEEK